MNLSSILTAMVLTVALSAKASLYTYSFASGFANSGNILDGNLSGWTDQRSLSGLGGGSIVDVSVKLNISGGYNGDLYAYLNFGNVLVPLLNRVGVGSGNAFGSSDAGLDVTLSSFGSDVHLASAAGGQLIGNYQVDGRTISPMSASGVFDGASRVTFSAYQNLNPNGVWTLFVADVSAGGGQSHVNSWELDITALPEPVNGALGIVACIFMASRYFFNRKNKLPGAGLMRTWF